MRRHTIKYLALQMLMVLSLASCANKTHTTKEVQADVFNQIKLADQAYEKGQWIEAERHYQVVIERAPKDAYAWFRLANTYLRQGRLPSAIQAYEAALQRNPEQARANYNLATAYLLQAQKALQTAYNQLPENDGAAVLIQEKLEQLKKIAYTPVEEVESPAKNLIKGN